MASKITNDNVRFLLKDTRLCKSPNMQKFFRSQEGRHMANHLEVIRWRHDKNRLWFVTLGWRVCQGIDTGFAGVSVMEVACQGSKASTSYPTPQTGSDYEIVTDWFWNAYRERGVVSIYEVWHVNIPHQLTHAEAHYV